MPDLDYGEGKTRKEDADDSVVMVAWTMIFFGVAVLIVAGLLTWWALS